MQTLRGLLIFISVVYSLNSFCQEDATRMHKYFVSKEFYQSRYNSKDSLGYKIIKGDTLIEVKSLTKAKGVPVPYEYKDSSFLDFYSKVAFQLNSKDSTKTQTMKYWKSSKQVK